MHCIYQYPKVRMLLLYRWAAKSNVILQLAIILWPTLTLKLLAMHYPPLACRALYL